MINKVLLLARTVKHLKFNQVAYQLYYRLKKTHNLHWFKNKIQAGPVYKPLNFNINYQLADIVQPANTFNFLNLQHSFNKAIDWNYQGYGKLWNYNLQYFNYLHQPDITAEQKQELLVDIGRWLETGKLQLEPYPVALRVMNAIRFISVGDIKNPTIIQDIYAQLAYLNDNLEYHLLGNHLLEDAFALFMGGHFFNVGAWRKTAKAILYKELTEQVLDDGAHFELSPMYHQIIFFRVLELFDWYKNINDDDAFLSFITQKAADMLGWLQLISFKNGDIPHFNDSASGITFTTLQLQFFAKQEKIEPNHQLMLKGSGYRKFHSQKYECAIDVGAIGPSYQPGHGHADALSFVLYINNEPLIVDTGTSTYQIGSRRSLERATRAHNTVEIGGKDQSEVWGGFRVGNRAKVVIDNESANVLTASHNGYQKSFGTNHQRKFNFAPDIISITDVQSAEGIPAKAYFHFHSNCKVAITAANEAKVEGYASLIFKGATNLILEPYQLANGYNSYLPAFCLSATFENELQTDIILND
ncbi:alginate lyase family protein [Mucilaginibacter sp. AK015]|uniref:heparinase II/III domain-containing protein n=1 Tax=Mucilaginibacter sp. AK015 TaxID=2723072 RepID=UPI00161CFFAF|nr:hypothetical protein [Mucilaginibacter sp. AK015]